VIREKGKGPFENRAVVESFFSTNYRFDYDSSSSSPPRTTFFPIEELKESHTFFALLCFGWQTELVQNNLHTPNPPIHPPGGGNIPARNDPGQMRERERALQHQIPSEKNLMGYPNLLARHIPRNIPGKQIGALQN
jgi:hypothetical protein